VTTKNKQQTAAQLLVRSLVQQKVKHIFGIPGGLHGHDLRVELPTSAEFLKTNFEDRALDEKIKAAEG
jgi:thiamine pyrophosphate-dependent acetolactate synthase large subunit-like protein